MVKVVLNDGVCSGTVIQGQILVTAAHCVVRSGSAVTASTVKVYAPGVDINQNNYVAQGFQIFFPSGFYNNTTYTEPNDIAFVVLDKKIEPSLNMKLASYELAQEIFNSGTTIASYGYGAVAQGGYASSVPYKMNSTPIAQARLRGYSGFERKYVNYASNNSGSSCPGDSGGPDIAEYRGSIYLVSVHNGGLGPCSDDPSRTPWQKTSTVSGEYQSLFDAALQVINKFKPSDVSNVRFSSVGTNGSISWDSPKNSPVVITGYLVKDEGANEVCKTASNTCQVSVKAGVNKFTVYTLGGNSLSNGVSIEDTIENAPIPEFIGYEVYQTATLVKWENVDDFGGASPESVFVEVRDENDGEVLCTAPIDEEQCSFEFDKKRYKLALNINSDLGATDSIFADDFSGTIYSSIVSRTLNYVEALNKNLNFYLARNPGYANEIQGFLSEIPVVDENLIFTEEQLSNLIVLRGESSKLISQIISKPRKITISCVKGKLNKKVTATNPKCPAGYRQA